MFWNPPLWYAILCFAIAFAALICAFVFVREVVKDQRR